jgi:hypothetical protein
LALFQRKTILSSTEKPSVMAVAPDTPERGAMSTYPAMTGAAPMVLPSQRSSFLVLMLQAAALLRSSVPAPVAPFARYRLVGLLSTFAVIWIANLAGAAVGAAATKAL